MGRDGVVGIVTLYGLDCPGIKSRWDEIFRVVQTSPEYPPSLLYNGYRVYFPGVKRPGRGVNHPPPSSAEVKERVELYLYSTLGGGLYFYRYLPMYCILFIDNTSVRDSRQR
jgi:hypothetical protein